MSSRKRKNPNNNELPAAKRQKSDRRHNHNNHNNNNNKKQDDKELKQSTFPFETAKPCDKNVPLSSKRQRLKLRNREQHIRIQQKTKEIQRLESQMKHKSQTYEYYHRLLITFANTFDQIFVSLQQKMNTNDPIPLC